MTLTEIKEKLKNLEPVHFELSHETVLLDSNTKLPVKLNIGDEQVFQRIKLCDQTERNHRLGCAHSSSNDTFNRLVEDLARQDEIIGKLQIQFNETVVHIYKLDHKKGDLEKLYAESL